MRANPFRPPCCTSPAFFGPHTSRTDLGVLTAQNHAVRFGLTESNEAQEAYHCQTKLCQTSLCLPDGPRTSNLSFCTSSPWPTTPSWLLAAGPPTALVPMFGSPATKTASGPPWFQNGRDDNGFIRNAQGHGNSRNRKKFQMLNGPMHDSLGHYNGAFQFAESTGQRSVVQYTTQPLINPSLGATVCACISFGGSAMPYRRRSQKPQVSL